MSELVISTCAVRLPAITGFLAGWTLLRRHRQARTRSRLQADRALYSTLPTTNLGYKPRFVPTLIRQLGKSDARA